jgi:hypothetical protein
MAVALVDAAHTIFTIVGDNLRFVLAWLRVDPRTCWVVLIGCDSLVDVDSDMSARCGNPSIILVSLRRVLTMIADLNWQIGFVVSVKTTAVTIEGCYNL